jgi:hypothetical protein
LSGGTWRTIDSGRKVGHLAELQFDPELAALLAQHVRHAEAGHRRHAIHHFIEVAGIDVDEVTVLQALLLERRIGAEVAHHADHEGQLLVFDGVADFDVVGHLDARRAYLLQTLLHTAVLGHDDSWLEGGGTGIAPVRMGSAT